MARALGKGFAVAAAAAVASVVFSLEGFAFSLWALDRDAGCRPETELCDLNAIGAALTGAIFGLEALAGTAIAGILLAIGKLNGAMIAVSLLVGLLALEHIW